MTPAVRHVVLFGRRFRKLFSLDLQSSLVPETAYGSATPTYTRATTKTFLDWEAVVRTVPSGCAAFTGARMVRNYAQNSNSFTAVGSCTVTAGQVDPDGGTTATRVVYAAATQSDRAVCIDTAWPAGTPTAVQSVWLKGAVGGETLKIWDGWSSRVDVTLTNTWRRYSTPPFTGNISASLLLYATSGTPTIFVARYQVEVVTGQSNQNPSEYVSTGSLSAPYQGAGVDGVGFYKTKNGNTVASNVVTEATGAAITPANGGSSLVCDASGPFGYNAEGARTNLILQSQTFNSSWTAVDSAVLADQIAAPDGTLTADKLTSGAAGSGHNLQQQVTVASNATVSATIYAKYGNHRWLGLGVYDSAWRIGTFDLLNGVVATKSAGVTSSIETLPNGWFRLQVVYTITGTSVYHGFFFLSGDNQATSWSPAGTENVYIWGAQLEAGSFASSYVPTVAAAVTRNADVLTYASAGNFSASQGTGYAEIVVGGGFNTGDPRVLSTNGTSNPGPILFNVAGQPRIYDTVTYASSGLSSLTLGAVGKCAGAWGAGVMREYLNSVAGTSHPFVGSMDAGTSIQIGGASASPFSTIRKVRLYDRALTAAQIAAVS